MFTIYTKPGFRRYTMLMLALFALSGCLPEGETDVPDEDPDGNPAATFHQISGSVGDGPVVAADILIMDSNQVSLGTTNSDSSANFDVSVETLDSSYPLLLESTGGTDLVTSAAPDFTMFSMVLQAGDESIANINPFTSIAFETARDLPGGLTSQNMQTGLATVARSFNAGLNSMAGIDTLNAEINAGNIAELVRAAEAVGEVVRRVRDNLASAGISRSGDDIVAAIGSDLTDNVLDGQGGPRADARIAALAGIALAQISLETMQNQLQVQGSDSMIRIENAISQVFSGTPVPAISELRSTAEMIDAARVGVFAANVLQASPDLATLITEIATLAPGMSVSQLRQRLGSNPSNAFVNSMARVASASDSELAVVLQVLRTGDADPQNSAPQISGTPLTQVAVGATYSFTPTASDADGDVLSFSISGQPQWATFDSSTGTLSGTPGANDTGSSPGIVISVTDGQETAVLAPFTITVTDVVVNTAPVINGIPATLVLAGDAYQFTPSASDADGDSLTFSVQNRPAWAAFDSQSGQLSGTPTNADTGDWNGIVISVSDGAASASLPAFNISVTQIIPPNQAPVISGTPDLTIEAGSLYRFFPTASDADGDTLVFSINGLPSWATFRSSDGRLRGTPASGDTGTYAGIVISVSDGQDTATLPAFAIQVTEPPNTAPQISGNPPADALAGSAYVFAPTATDADGDTLTFSVSGLPGWASFNANTGAITGTPSAADTGVYSGISISVSDGSDSATLGPFSITVTEVVLGSATLTWNAPTLNTDGSPLNDLAGYRIYWGTTPGVYTDSVTINNPGVTTYVVENLAPGTYEFVSTALNSAGVESDYSNTASKTIN